MVKPLYFAKQNIDYIGNLKKIMAKLLSFSKTFCLLEIFLSLLNKPLPLIKPFFYRLNICF